MIWSSWSEFINMGGYAGFVWWSYGVTAAFMIGEVILLGRRRRTVLQRLARLIKANKHPKTTGTIETKQEYRK
ncbi:MAG: heme exporter protein CcmD [Gammaproteobacteria bacterium]|nr:heme exporter protein CcmD [Gammaproteobacteria bacterium]